MMVMAEAMMTAPMATAGAKADEYAWAVAISVPAMATPIPPTPMAVAERPIMDGFNHRRLATHDVRG
jgi:hypothetical protein